MYLFRYAALIALVYSVSLSGSLPTAVAETGSADSPGKPDSVSCDEYMEAYVRSASRKLYRALVGHDFHLRNTDFVGEITLEVNEGSRGASKVRFKVVQEKGGKVAGLMDVDRIFRRTLIVAHTNAGPIVASMLWPGPEALAGGRACKPTRSRIHSPDVPLSKRIDIEPFKFWGLRIVWRLPASFVPASKPSDTPLRKTLVQIMNDE